MGVERLVPAYRLLPDESVGRIHESALTVLDRVGIEVPHPRILGLLADAGARVDRATSRALLPPSLIEAALRSAPAGYTLYGRDRTRFAAFGQSTPNHLSSAGQHQILDHRTGRRREPLLADLAEAATVANALPNIDIVGAFVVPRDVPIGRLSARSFVETLKRTTKPVAAWIFNRSDADATVEILRAVSGGSDALRRYPLYEGFLEPISPLRFRPEGLEIVEVLAAAGLPIGCGPMAQTGATAPVTLAGTLVQEHAEILAGLAIVQLLAPGLPVTYWGIPHVFDFKTTSISFGSPEQALMAAAHCQLAARLGLPVGTNTGLTDSKSPDEQAGAERGITLLLGALAGSDIFGHRGIAGADGAASLVELAIEDEIAGYVRRLMRGFEVNAETLALEVIERVGVGGSFLADDHTLDHWRDDVWYPSIFDRRPWDSWHAGGSPTVADRARERVEALLAGSKEPPLDDSLAAELDRIVESLAE